MKAVRALAFAFLEKRAGGRRPGSGRKLGSRNKATIERELLVKQAMAEAGMPGVTLAKDALVVVQGWFLQRAQEAAGAFMALPEPSPEDKDANKAYASAERRVTHFMTRLQRVAADPAPYQSPTMQRVTVAEADPFENMTDEELWLEAAERARRLGFVPLKQITVKRGH